MPPSTWKTLAETIGCSRPRNGSRKRIKNLKMKSRRQLTNPASNSMPSSARMNHRSKNLPHLRNLWRKNLMPLTRQSAEQGGNIGEQSQRLLTMSLLLGFSPDLSKVRIIFNKLMENTQPQVVQEIELLSFQLMSDAKTAFFNSSQDYCQSFCSD